MASELETTLAAARAEGCRAILYDDGLHQSFPTCMGGMVLHGCIEPEACIEMANERLGSPDRQLEYRTNDHGVVVHLNTPSQPDRFQT